jgi:cyclophilin family peptidyl-prolyl cis-trans isomerase
VDESEPKIRISRAQSPEDVARAFIRSGDQSFDYGPIGPDRRRRQIMIAVAIGVVVIVVAVVGVVVSRHGAKSPTKSPASNGAQSRADAKAVAAGCPAHPSTAPVPELSAQPSQVLVSNTLYSAKVSTTAGTFSFVLYTGNTAAEANDFVFLAQQGAFKCLAFNQVVPNGIVVAGDAIPNEGSGTTATANVAVGAVMAPLGGQSSVGGGQWFVVTGANGQSQPSSYVAFGRIISGLDVAKQIAAAGSGNAGPPRVIHRILSVVINHIQGPA